MKNNLIRFLFLLLLISSCTEPYPLESEGNFEDLLVVEAQITNKLKKQKVKVSRTYQFGELGPVPETGAEVYIEDDQGNTFAFQYTEADSSFTSVSEFQALPERSYQLLVITSGKEYTSTPEELTTHTEIENIDVERRTVDGMDGVEIMVNSHDPSGTAVYYRYEYEETYKVVTPYTSNIKLAYVEPELPWQPLEIGVVATNEYKYTCYPTRESKEIILYNTSTLATDEVVDFPVKFISRESGLISHRYSIQVTQYVESYEAYSFYETLQKLSQEGSVLSPTQPGFIYGNISSTENAEEKVIGFFDVASESSERIFFNHGEFFPNNSVLPYIYECEVWEMPYVGEPESTYSNETFASIIEGGNYVLIEDDGTTRYMVNVQCGDCSSFASPEPPEFWEE